MIFILGNILHTALHKLWTLPIHPQKHLRTTDDVLKKVVYTTYLCPRYAVIDYVFVDQVCCNLCVRAANGQRRLGRLLTSSCLHAFVQQT